MLSEIDSSNIRSYESGRSMLSILTLVKIADALRTTPAELLDRVTADMFGKAAPPARRSA